MINDFEDAKDISQEAFIRVYKAINRFNPELKFYTWFYRIITNLCIDYLRSKKEKISIEKIPEIISNKSNTYPYNKIEREDLRKKIDCVLKKMPAKYKTLIVLRDLQELSCKEISRVVKCSYGTARWRLYKARKIFRDLWEKTFEEKEEK